MIIFIALMYINVILARCNKQRNKPPWFPHVFPMGSSWSPWKVRLVDWLVATEGCQNFRPQQAQRRRVLRTPLVLARDPAELKKYRVFFFFCVPELCWCFLVKQQANIRNSPRFWWFLPPIRMVSDWGWWILLLYHFVKRSIQKHPIWPWMGFQPHAAWQPHVWSVNG